MGPPSAATALKEVCGSQKPPEITRKITACVACRKLKIKCHMTDSKPPCSRCKTRGLSCTVNKSIQMILDSDLTWKEDMQQRVEELERQVSAGSVGHSAHDAGDGPEVPVINAVAEWHTDTALDAMALDAAQAPQELSLNVACSLGSFPASALTGLPTSDSGASLNTRADLVTRGVLSLTTAESLYRYYHDSLDSYIYSLLNHGDTLSAVRSRSSLLLSAICTVAAYCSGADAYSDCLKAFRNEVAAELFAADHSFDDIRALCIGSFWLTGGTISTTLSTMAVQFALQMNLHRCITKMPHRDPKCHARTRLYFVVVICDHSCSLAHGRPPMTRAMRSLQNPRALLQSSFSVPEDLKLISHLELWTLNSRVLDSFGADVGNRLPDGRMPEIDRLSQYYDRWRQQWVGLLAGRDDLSTLVLPTLDLYFHASKLCLFSHVFRGPSSTPTSAHSSGFENAAVDNALSFVQCFMAIRVEAQRLPAYFSTIIAFSAVLLLGVCSSARGYVQADRYGILNNLLRLSGLLNGLSVAMHPTHPLCAIIPNLDETLNSALSAPRSEPALIVPSAPNSPDHFDFSGPSDDALRLTSTPNIDWTKFPIDFAAEFPEI